MRNAKTVHPHFSGTGRGKIRLGRIAREPSEGRPRRPRSDRLLSCETPKRGPSLPMRSLGDSGDRCSQVSDWRAVPPRGNRRRQQRVSDSRSIIVWGLPQSAAPASFAQLLRKGGVRSVAAEVRSRGRGVSRHIVVEFPSSLERDLVFPAVARLCHGIGAKALKSRAFATRAAQRLGERWIAENVKVSAPQDSSPLPPLLMFMLMLLMRFQMRFLLTILFLMMMFVLSPIGAYSLGASLSPARVGSDVPKLFCV